MLIDSVKSPGRTLVPIRAGRWAPAGWTLLVGLVSLVPLLLRVPLFGAPMMNDEGIFATMGRDILRGGLPYRDLFDIVPPMTPVWYAVAFLLLGEHPWVPQVMLSVALCLTAALVYFAGCELYSARFGLVAALLFSVATGFHQLGIWAMDEALTVPLATAAVVCLLRALRTARLPWLGAAGLLTSVACLTNQLAGFYALAAVALIWNHLPGPRLRRAQGLAMFAALGAVPVLILIAIYAAAGALNDLLYGAVRYPLLYGSGPALAARASRSMFAPLWFSIIEAPIVWLALLGFVALLAERGRNASVLLAWTLAAALVVAAPGTFYRHYFVALLPVIALAGTAGFRYLVAASARRRLALVAVTLLTGYVAVLASADAYRERGPAQRHVATGFAGQRIREVQAERMARLVSEALPADETFYSLGRNGQLYFLADRRPPSRFFHSFPFFADPSTLDRAIRDLEQSPPALIIDTDWPAVLEGELTRYSFAMLPFLHEHYTHAGRIPFDADLLDLHHRLSRHCADCMPPAYFADVYVRNDQLATAELLIPRR